MKTNAIIRIAAVIGVLCAFSLLTTSCKSKEEKAISQLESLCQTVEKESFDAKDLDSIQAKYEAIHESLKDCNFNNDQLKEVAKLEARFAKAVAKKALQRVGDAVEGVLEGLSSENE